MKNDHDCKCLVENFQCLSDGIWCVRTLKDGKSMQLLAEKLEDYPESEKLASLLEAKNAIYNVIYDFVWKKDALDKNSVKKLCDLIFKEIKDVKIFVDTKGK